MLQKHTLNQLTWVDLEQPTQEEVTQVMQEYGIDPLVGDELISTTLRSKVDVYPNFIYLILHFPGPQYNKQDGQENQEVDFIIGRDFIITARYQAMDPLYSFSKAFEVSTLLNRSNMGNHAGYILFYMLRKIYRSLLHDLEHIKDRLHKIEAQIFAGKEKEMVFDLSHTNRVLLRFKEAMSVHREILTSFEFAGKKFFGEEFDYYLRSMLGEYNKVDAAIQSCKDYLGELRDTNDSLLTTKQNEIMKVFTVLAFVTFPLSILANILSINGVEQYIGSILIGTAIVIVCMLIYFRHKKWL